MLKTERMTRALLVGTMDALEETVDFLYKSRLCHIINFKKDDVYDIGTPLPYADETSSKLLKMMGISKNLELGEEEISVNETFSTAKIHSEVDAALTHFDLEISAEPGKPAKLSFVAENEGIFRLRCSVTCGDMHPFMIGKLRVGPNTLLWRGIGITLLAIFAVIFTPRRHAL